jgi:hypothetical protein
MMTMSQTPIQFDYNNSTLMGSCFEKRRDGALIVRSDNSIQVTFDYFN